MPYKGKENVFSTCPSVCECPRETPRCELGVSLVTDRCGCCKVCARQLNEDCSNTEPCDHIKGLQCNFGASWGATKGICRAKLEGRPCEFNNKMYQNGETFQPSCKHQCTCIDGAVGCVQLCLQELSIPALGCLNPTLVKVPGQCCDKWVCEDTDNLKVKKGQTKAGQPDENLTQKNKMFSRFKGKPQAAFRGPPVTRILSSGQKCVTDSTSWSPCSKTCGVGVSTRVTNNNPQCKLVKESRICQVRPCSPFPQSGLKRGKKCSRTEKPKQPVKLTYAGCSSMKKYWPKYCGSCLDGRCCHPEQTRTLPVQFHCDNGETFIKDVMMIQSCKCSSDCPLRVEGPLPMHRLENDMHRFTNE
ncbi:CCN family member 1-like isoform X2 [Clupea harengus]|uniref:CCN family member 1 n=1 Tax=Clupea harengus TaxID=7950 RepID=A0A8M1KEI6_CLUHA|nr:CCN family member 1-like isoform X2 [Clupea harengus]